MPNQKRRLISKEAELDRWPKRRRFAQSATY